MILGLSVIVPGGTAVAASVGRSGGAGEG